LTSVNRTPLGRQRINNSMQTYYLCVKTHSITGLKYLCQTRRKDPCKYKGSGAYWLEHLSEHGSAHTTEILHICSSKEELRERGLHYSALWNIVESNEWANLKPENGGGGWHLFGDKNPQKRKSVREKTSLGMKKYLDENPEKLEKWIKWRNEFWTPERIIELNTGGRGTVSVTDLNGNSRRIPKSEFDSMDRSRPVEHWLFVSVTSNESKRRRELQESP
jgi:hypothetical protein